MSIITIKLSSHAPFTMQVNTASSVADVKAAVLAQHNIPVEKQHVLYKGLRLESNKILSQCGVSPGAAVDVVFGQLPHSVLMQAQHFLITDASSCVQEDVLTKHLKTLGNNSANVQDYLRKLVTALEEQLQSEMLKPAIELTNPEKFQARIEKLQTLQNNVQLLKSTELSHLAYMNSVAQNASTAGISHPVAPHVQEEQTRRVSHPAEKVRTMGITHPRTLQKKNAKRKANSEDDEEEWRPNVTDSSADDDDDDEPSEDELSATPRSSRTRQHTPNSAASGSPASTFGLEYLYPGSGSESRSSTPKRSHKRDKDHPSCHQCKTKKPSWQLYYCRNRSVRTRKNGEQIMKATHQWKFCERCLSKYRKYPNANVPLQPPVPAGPFDVHDPYLLKWDCPACDPANKQVGCICKPCVTKSGVHPSCGQEEKGKRVYNLSLEAEQGGKRGNKKRNKLREDTSAMDQARFGIPQYAHNGFEEAYRPRQFMQTDLEQARPSHPSEPIAAAAAAASSSSPMLPWKAFASLASPVPLYPTAANDATAEAAAIMSNDLQLGNLWKPLMTPLNFTGNLGGQLFSPMPLTVPLLSPSFGLPALPSK
jgi:hypothetical protein